MTEVTMERVPVLAREIAERLRDVGHRVDFVDHDIQEVRDLEVEAESRVDTTEATVSGVSRRLERLEQSNEVL